MKNLKTFELFETEYKHPLYFRMREVSNKLIKMFFNNDDRTGEEMSCDDNIKYDFYFDNIPTKNIISCKNFISNFIKFSLDLNDPNEPYAILSIVLSIKQFEDLEEKLELKESTKKYNL